MEKRIKFHLDENANVGWVEALHPTIINNLNRKCWVALRLTQPTGDRTQCDLVF